jgi:hypothetical protein
MLAAVALLLVESFSAGSFICFPDQSPAECAANRRNLQRKK